ncbi:MAG: hypothetical protein ETSY2_51520 [Candidatus Entotheonella gemina]|uniref:Uncharacterized protein n=1 Tax=Candidatus Entotheonella gemina TaxID=1429439 RepID=W4L666_9BACT|nr:MAG: hypothetical protein ETSY2_51520 [Candidatus Entotheonella gemina]
MFYIKKFIFVLHFIFIVIFYIYVLLKVYLFEILNIMIRCDLT